MTPYFMVYLYGPYNARVTASPHVTDENVGSYFQYKLTLA